MATIPNIGQVDFSFGFKPTELKTADYTAKIGELVRVSTASSAVVVTFPANPNIGDYFKIALVNDHASNTVTVNRNGQNVKGSTDVSALVLETEGQFLMLEFVGGDTEWTYDE